MEEIEKHGAYPTSDKFNDKSHMIRENKLPIPHKEHNPYVEAFWKWWPELYRGLDTFRITGGEPLCHQILGKYLIIFLMNQIQIENLNLQSTQTWEYLIS
jgi:organic radical activating enzyme